MKIMDKPEEYKYECRRTYISMNKYLVRGIVTKRGALDMQVCVPADWSDVDVKQFADTANLCGTENGWQIRKQGDKALAGDDERVICNDDKNRVHIMLDA